MDADNNTNPVSEVDFNATEEKEYICSKQCDTCKCNVKNSSL